MSEIRQAVEEICERFGFRVVDGEDAGNLAYDFNGRVMDFVIQAENVDGNWADWIAFGEHEGWPELISCDTDRANIWLCQTRPDITADDICEFTDQIAEATDFEIEVSNIVDPEDWQEIAGVANAYDDPRFE